MDEASEREVDGSVDDVAEDFFDGLDEEAFISDLQVVSSWGEGSAKGAKGKEEKDRDESALSKFRSFLEANPSCERLLSKERQPDIGRRRDPDKTERDIRKDKANKTKDTLIKKMETGLIPPGMELSTPSAVSTPPLRPRAPGNPGGYRPPPSLFRAGPMILRRPPPRRPSPDRGRRPRRMSPDRRPRRSPRSPERPRERPRERRRTRSRSRPRQRRRSRDPSETKPKEDFLTYLSKNNLIGPEHMAPQPDAEPSPYAVIAYPVAYGGAPPAPVPPPDPSQIFPSSDSFFLGQTFNYADAPAPDLFYGQPTSFKAPDARASLLNVPLDSALTDHKEQTQMPRKRPRRAKKRNKSMTIPVIMNQGGIISGEKGGKIIKKSEIVAKKLNDLRVPIQLTLKSKEDHQQRDGSFGGVPFNVEYKSPLNRDSSAVYNFTSTGDKNRMLVPSILATVQDELPHLRQQSQYRANQVDAFTQTSSGCCDRCRLNERYPKQDKETRIYRENFQKSVLSQVNEDELASSKMIFTPNQQLQGDPNNSVSLTHMTPAQILVHELQARAKMMQRSQAESTHNQPSGGFEDRSKRFDDQKSFGNPSNSNHGFGNSSNSNQRFSNPSNSNQRFANTSNSNQGFGNQGKNPGYAPNNNFNRNNSQSFGNTGKKNNRYYPNISEKMSFINKNFKK